MQGLPFCVRIGHEPLIELVERSANTDLPLIELVERPANTDLPLKGTGATENAKGSIWGEVSLICRSIGRRFFLDLQ